MVANVDDANADRAKEIRDEIIASMTEQLVTEISFKKKHQAVTLDATFV